MPVYVDPISTYSDAEFSNPAARRYGNRWCHMISDDLDELHALAQKIGLRRDWFQSGASILHYDLVPSKRALAVRHGAIEISHEERLAMRETLLTQKTQFTQTR